MKKINDQKQIFPLAILKEKSIFSNNKQPTNEIGEQRKYYYKPDKFFERVNSYILKNILPRVSYHDFFWLLTLSFLTDYHFLFRLNGELFLIKVGTFLKMFPSLNDALLHNFAYLGKDELENRSKHILEYLFFFPLSTLDDFFHAYILPNNKSYKTLRSFENVSLNKIFYHNLSNFYIT